MKISIKNQQEFDYAVKFATQLAKKDKNFECDILYTTSNLFHVYLEYVQVNTDKQELRILVKESNLKKFNLVYNQ